jgi:hypothetical protein
MYPIHIEVRGPGGTIWPQMDSIKKLIEDAGGEVEVVDDYPHKADSPLPSQEQTLEYLGKTKVVLTAVHLPWGG